MVKGKFFITEKHTCSKFWGGSNELNMVMGLIVFKIIFNLRFQGSYLDMTY